MDIIKKFVKNFDNITKYYNYLVDKTKRHENVFITNEWLIDNYYILAEHYKSIIGNKKSLKKNIKILNNNYYFLREIVSNKNYDINFKYLVNELKEYQKNTKKNFTYRELGTIITTLIIIYFDRLNDLCRSEYSKLVDCEEVSRIIESTRDVSLDSFNLDDLSDSHYIFFINSQLYKVNNSSRLFKKLNEYLKENNISLKGIINEEFQDNINNNVLISNIFNNLKDFFEYSTEKLFEGVSRTERKLLSDPVYKKMTDESKELYRSRLIKLARRSKMDEYSYLKKIYDDDEHIGFKLFKSHDNTFRVIFYIMSVIIISGVLSYYLSGLFIKYRVIGFIILFIPISQLVLQLINHFIIKFVPTNTLPKLDYSKGLPDSARCMVVIPTIVSSKEKIKEMFDCLEEYYLVNKTDNLYFTLLGDVKASKHRVESYDSDISSYGEEYARGLNEKYGKELFYFIYRKRVWNKGEGEYLGYERKRGALIQFNKILLGESVDNNRYFNVNMLDGKKLDIKYVITLDTDTKLLLNSVSMLVGAMDHPLNRPILNKEGSRVISGYGIMQPRVGVDIEATNRSLYSQIFAGIGGFDAYSAVVPNVYQDAFFEGSFVGKGIYDLEVFDSVLSNAFPDNIVLSHDLLEGNYLRCGYVSDVELLDDFPSKFLVDVTRQHRWARGDTQIIGWLFNRVYNKDNVKVNNPLNLLERFKIFDNIYRMFLNPSLLLILLLAFTTGNSYLWVGLVILEIAFSIFFFLKSKMYKRSRNQKEIYYKNLYYGGRSILLRSYIVFATIPYYAKLYMDAFFRSLYRLIYSHKNLLNWVTAEEVSSSVNNGLFNYIKSFIFNIIVSIIFILVAIKTNNYLAYLLAFVFISAPFVLYLVSCDIDHHVVDLGEEKVDNMYDLARRTWSYFEDNLTDENNYLIPDNYQDNRENKYDDRTSPTAIGFSLTSIVSACEIGIIDNDRAVDLINKVLSSISSLKKWHGNLYNWYNIKTKEVLRPNFVSTIDSGNLVASLIVCKEFLKSVGADATLCTKLIDRTNLKRLYTKQDVFSIGYDEDDGRLSIYNYNKFASESRLTSFVAIAKGDAPSKHWMCLDKSLTTYKGRKGLISWSGTSFEYYMPLLFMRNYPNTLLDETYNFVHFCEKDYINGVDKSLPWGISESAYNELDNALNYKYKSFSTPYLKAKEDKDNRIVISPYSSLMVMELYPDDVYNNIKKFKGLGMYGQYGFYESYDYDDKAVVKAYFAHHLGMSLVGICNYLSHGAIQNLFHSDINIKAFEVLLKEKVQIKSSIDMKMAAYKKYNYDKEIIQNDIRAFNYISYLPEVSVLSNKKYSLIMNDRGDSFSRYRTLQLNRYRKVTEQDYGIFLFIKDVCSGQIWSNTYAPMNVKPDKYEVVFASDKIKFLRRDGGISTKTEIVVCKDYHAEIRKITFKNEDDIDRCLEITSYTEPIISENMDDVSHKVFNSMFVSTKYDSDTNSLIARRKSRGDSSVNSYFGTKLLINNALDDYSYETERGRFIGRNNLLSNASLLNGDLSNYAGDNIDPILSIRNRIMVPANDSVSIYLIAGFGRSLEQLRDIMYNYNNKNTLDKEFSLSTLMNIINTKHIGIDGDNMRTYNIMLNYLFQTTRLSVNNERMDILRRNALGISGLWKFGVSGDRPIILVQINDIRDISFITDILKAFEYYKNNSIFVDIIIINNESGESKKLIKREIDDELYKIYNLNSFYHTPGSVTVIDGDSITREDRSLLDEVPRIRFILDEHIGLREAVNRLQRSNKISESNKTILEDNNTYEYKGKLEFDNGYGGFRSNGREYVIYNKNTPAPWSNVIANDSFGSIVTNNGCGYTYGYNSSEFKISSWTNEMVLNDKSEGFKFDGKLFDPECCVHGFGYSILESETDTYKHTITEFIPRDDNVKVYLMKLENKTNKKINSNIDFWINPVLGNFEEKTSRHILSEYIESDNYLKMRNVYSNDYSDVIVFMSSSLDITDCISDRMLVKSIGGSVSLNKGEAKEIVFVLGCGYSDSDNLELIKKYSSVSVAKRELKRVKDYWNEMLSVIHVDSNDKSFDYMMNGWYLYQTLSSRIMAKAGFYQVSGAFGYRDQLQDCMNVVYVDPDRTRKQILINASHQFIEGDVLHWWHDKNHFGLRSRFRDDFVWLVYATCIYIDVTGDYSILDESVPYIEGESLSDYESEKGIIFNYSSVSESLFNHCLKSLELSMSSLGAHKLPLMGGGDWNDGMNRVGIKGRGESVWLGFFLYNTIDMFTNIVKKYNKDFDISSYLKFNKELNVSLNKKAWDGEYYLRAYFDNGDKLGSHENSECKIDLISQSFSIISGVAPKDRVESTINSVEDNLVDNKLKIVKLLTPAFSRSLNNPGYIMNYPKGIRENGGQYTHSVAWYLMALIKAGYYDRAYRYFQMINPINRTKSRDECSKYYDEPYVIAADIYSTEHFASHGGWTWYTGSSGWFYQVGIRDILGLRKHGDKLYLDPKIPVAWTDYKVTYKYKRSIYLINVSKGKRDTLTMDGKRRIENYIVLKDDSMTHDVELVIKI